MLGSIAAQREGRCHAGVPCCLSCMQSYRTASPSLTAQEVQHFLQIIGRMTLWHTMRKTYYFSKLVGSFCKLVGSF